MEDLKYHQRDGKLIAEKIALGLYDRGIKYMEVKFIHSMDTIWIEVRNKDVFKTMEIVKDLEVVQGQGFFIQVSTLPLLVFLKQWLYGLFTF